MSEDQNKDSREEMILKVSRIASATGALYTGTGVFLLIGWIILDWLFPNQAAWPTALVVFPLAYTTYFLLNPQGSTYLRASIAIFLLLGSIWLLIVSINPATVFSLIISLLSTPYILKGRQSLPK